MSSGARLGWSILLWGAVAVMFPLLMQQSSSGLIVSWVAGGVAAGLMIVVPQRQWWTVLVPFAGAVAAVFVHLGYPNWLNLVRTIGDVLAVLTYVLVLRGQVGAATGLGASLGRTALALSAATLLRLLPIWLVGAVGGGPTAQLFADYWPALALATISGLLAGSSLVIGLSRWREIAPSRVELRMVVRVSAANAAVILVVLGTDTLSRELGGDLATLPLLIWAAVCCSIAYNAVLSGVVVVVIAAGFAHDLGVYVNSNAADLTQIVHLQAYLALLVMVRAALVEAIDTRHLAERRATASLANLEAVFRDAPVPTALTWVDDTGRMIVTDVNAGFREALGWQGPVAGVPLRTVLGADVDIDPDQKYGPAFPARRADGRELWLRATISLLAGVDSDTPIGPGRAAIVVFDDVTGERAYAELQRIQAGYDGLTGLANRELLVEQLDGIVGPKAPLGLALVNINGMADLNEAVGHPAGDEVLLTAATRLSAAAAPGDVVARYGGDVFAVVRPNVASEEHLEALVADLVAAIEAPITVAGREVVVTASAGSAYADQPAASERDAIRVADGALKEARRAGRRVNVVRRVTGDPHAGAVRLELELSVRAALDAGDMDCVYQPIVDPVTQRIASVEALARMQDARGNPLSPAVFIPLAGELGLLGRLSDLVLGFACDQAARWAQAGHPVRVGINAPHEWLTPESERLIHAELASRGLPTSALGIEITEDQTLDLSGPAIEVLQRLSAAGITIAIDDFGTGWSGLAAFRDTPADVLKIDRGFIAAMVRSPDGLDLVAAIIDLAHRFTKAVVAEGVETPQQLAELERLHCDYVQGYLTGRPLTAAELTGRLAAEAAMARFVEAAPAVLAP